MSATVSTTCARCSATIDLAAVERHHERCFVVGDWVRWWPDGEADLQRYSEVCVADTLNGSPYTAVIDSHGPRWSSEDGLNGQRVLVNRGTLRHIQRPEQAVLKDRLEQISERIRKLDEMRMEHLASRMPKQDAELQDAMGRVEPTLYDGLTAEQCLARWSGNRTAVEHGEPPLFSMTTEQIAVAKRLYLDVADNTWSRILRARISAAKERERCRVRIEQDAEDEPWR